MVDALTGLIYDVKSGHVFFFDWVVNPVYVDVSCKGREYVIAVEVPGWLEPLSLFGYDLSDVAFQIGNDWWIVDTGVQPLSFLLRHRHTGCLRRSVRAGGCEGNKSIPFYYCACHNGS